MSKISTVSLCEAAHERLKKFANKNGFSIPEATSMLLEIIATNKRFQKKSRRATVEYARDASPHTVVVTLEPCVILALAALRQISRISVSYLLVIQLEMLMDGDDVVGLDELTMGDVIAFKADLGKVTSDLFQFGITMMITPSIIPKFGINSE